MGLYGLTRPLLFSLPAETAHHLGLAALRTANHSPIRRLLSRQFTVDDPRLRTTLWDIDFPNPVGVAAGFDKNARVPGALGALGFGFVEVGGVTAQPQAGNPRPRLFRLPEDKALVNRLGLNNEGADTIGRRLAGTDVDVPVGVNIAKSEDVDAEGAPADYRHTYECVADGGDFFVVNVSCPNSQGFEELQNRESLAAILEALTEAGASPLLVKLSPDLPEPAAIDALELVDAFDLDGVVATNTTTERPETLASPNRVEPGGLSGAPLSARSTAMVRLAAQHVDAPVIGVGGVATAADAYEKIRAGASLVELYTAFVYRGPAIAREINRNLLDLLEEDGFDSVEAAVGADL
ncbi:MAG: quinone-dependent dihydroorotate dehydrogenase [Salinirussus sp.]